MISFERNSVVPIDLFTTRHKVVHNGGSPNFKGSLFDKKTNYLTQILQSLSYKVYSIIGETGARCNKFAFELHNFLSKENKPKQNITFGSPFS